MHNGCICCTLRGDLLKTVKSLSQEGDFDYLVIESTGISEPLPVAQTFVMDVDSMQPKEYDANTSPNKDSNPSEGKLTVAADERQSLFHYAKLDTLVTVVAALNIYDVLASGEILIHWELDQLAFDIRDLLTFSYTCSNSVISGRQG